jgi:DNA replication protein DnaC
MEELIRKRLRQLKLAGMIDTLDVRNEYAIKSNISYLEFLSLLLEDEINSRADHSFKNRLRRAHFPYYKTLEEFDFSFQPNLNKKQIYDLATCGFIRKKESVVFIGPPGVGKTHLSIAIGIKALMQGYKVLFTTVHDLMTVLFASKADNTYHQKMKLYSSVDLLILDELGYKRLNQATVDEFFEIISRRYEKGAMIITSNKSFQEWVDILWDPVLTTAILDRIIHHCHLIMIKGESYRMREQKLRQLKDKDGS